MARMFRNIKAYMGRYDFTGKSNALKLDYSVDEKPVPVLDSNTEITFPGLQKIQASIGGFMDVGDPAVAVFSESVLMAAIGEVTGVPVSFSPIGADGDRAFGFQAIRFDVAPISGKAGDVHPFEAKLGHSAGRIFAGRVGLPAGTISGASGNGTAYQLGALSASQRLYAHLHVLAVSAGGSVVFKVQSDNAVGFPSAVDQLTFTAATGATEQAMSVAGAVTDDYWRVNYARTGGASFSAVLIFGIGPA